MSEPPAQTVPLDAPQAGHARYSRVARLIHWITAALILANISLAWRMENPPGPAAYAVFQLHKSIGITVLLLTVLRIVWRLAHPAPPLSPTLARWERALAHLVHFSFYLLLLGLPLSGWLLVSTSPRRIATWLFGAVPWPHLPIDEAVAPAVNAGAHLAHALLGYLAYLLIALHLAGALKHHFLDRDGELRRMLPGRTPVKLWDGRLAVVLLVAVAVVALTKSYPWSRPAPPPSAAADPQAAAAPAPAPVALPPPNVAAAAPPPQTPVEPSRWHVDKSASSLGFRAAWNGKAVSGGFGAWRATIVFDPVALDRSSVTADIDLASVTASDASAASALPGGDWLDAVAHPRATFTARRFRALGGRRYKAQGRLTLRGVARPLTLPFTLAINGDTARMQGRAGLSRTAFGVGQGEWAATDQVADKVEVEVRIVATRETP